MVAGKRFFSGVRPGMKMIFAALHKCAILLTNGTVARHAMRSDGSMVETTAAAAAR